MTMHIHRRASAGAARIAEYSIEWLSPTSARVPSEDRSKSYVVTLDSPSCECKSGQIQAAAIEAGRMSISDWNPCKHFARVAIEAGHTFERVR